MRSCGLRLPATGERRRVVPPGVCGARSRSERQALSGARNERETGVSAALAVSATGVEQGSSDPAPIACVDANELAGLRVGGSRRSDHGDRGGQSGRGVRFAGLSGVSFRR